MKNYFSHDYNARNDKKLVKAFMKYGLSAIGAYWCIIEMLYEESGFLPLSECDRIAFELRTDETIINFLINNCELFENDGEKFWSSSAIKRLDMRNEKSQKAKDNANKRWSDANAMRSHNNGNAIKENKIKEKKKEKGDSDIRPLVGEIETPQKKPFQEQRDFYKAEYMGCENKPKRRDYYEFIQYLMDLNVTKKPIEVILKMPNQLTFSQFTTLMSTAKENDKPHDIRTYCNIILNDPNRYVNKQSVFLTLKSFIDR